jgi:hypothetical protein
MYYFFFLLQMAIGNVLEVAVYKQREGTRMQSFPKRGGRKTQSDDFCNQDLMFLLVITFDNNVPYFLQEQFFGYWNTGKIINRLLRAFVKQT